MISDADQYVYGLTSTSQDGFGRDATWARPLIDRGVLCGHCGWLYEKNRQEIEYVQVDNNYVQKTHLGTIGEIVENAVFSKVFTEVVGRTNVERLGRLVPIVDNKLGRLRDFECSLIDQSVTPGTTRGPAPVQPSLCRDCSRLAYWPGWPPTTWYVLRRELPKKFDLCHLGDIVCSADLWENTIKPAKLPKVRAYKMAILDEPTDGWPADYQEMIRELDRRGIRK